MFQILIASTRNPANYAVGRGLWAFLIFAGFGIRLIWQGLWGTIARDVFGDPRFASPGYYILAGVLLQVPLVLYIIFILRQGYGS
jgi:hypothetical protein